MLRFLGPDWLAALDEAARAVTLPAELTLRVERVVTGVPGGRVCFRLEVDGGRMRVRPGGDGTPADVTLTSDVAVAVALARGQTNAERAIADGGLGVDGDLGALLRTGPALAALGDIFAAVRSSTCY